MGKFEVKDIRTIGIIGPNGSGKTTLVDALMYASGANTRQGSVDQGTSLSDTTDEEKARKTSIRATCLNCQFEGKNIFLIDTPGYADFWGEVIVTLEVVDSVVIVVDGVTGLEPGTRRAWKAAREKNLPISFFITKLDKEHSNFAAVLANLEKEGGSGMVPLLLPDGNYPNFSAVTGLLEEGAEAKVEESLRSRISRFREKIIEAAAETDDALMEKYFEDGTLEPDETRMGFRKALATGGVTPVLAGAALNGVGIKKLLGVIAEYFPSPEDRGKVKVGDAELEPNPSAPFCALVFKTVYDPFVGQLSYLRVWAGTLKSDSEVFNASSGEKERIGHLYLIKGKEQTDLSAAPPGYVVALPKLKETSIGDTLCDSGQKYVFPPITFPSPTAIMAVYSKAQGDEDKIAAAFHKFTEEDPTLTEKRDPMTREYVISGLGETQIQVAMNRLKNEFHVEAELRAPKVAYKETLKGRGETKYRHKKQTGGAGQFAEVWMHVQPYQPGAENAEGKGKKELIELPWGGKFLFVDEVVGGHIPTQLVQSVKKGYLSALEKGALAGFPVVDVTATVYDGKTHPVDSKDIAFQIAGRQGFREAAAAARPVLLEPVMNVTITIATEYLGNITGDLNSRRGRILGIKPEGPTQVIRAQVPIAELLRYTPELRSLTGGTGEFTMEFDHYEEVPGSLAQKIISQVREEKEEG